MERQKKRIFSFMVKKVFEDFSNPTSRHLEASPIFSKGWGPLALSGQPNILNTIQGGLEKIMNHKISIDLQSYYL